MAGAWQFGNIYVGNKISKTCQQHVLRKLVLFLLLIYVLLIAATRRWLFLDLIVVVCVVAQITLPERRHKYTCELNYIRRELWQWSIYRKDLINYSLPVGVCALPFNYTPISADMFRLIRLNQRTLQDPESVFYC